jgi:hypothetical protein
VVLAGEHERAHHGVAVDGLGDLVGVLLDDREQVREQRALEVREVVGRVRESGVRVVREVDLTVAGDRDCAVLGRAARDRRRSDVLLRVGCGLYAAASIGSLVRYRSPSSRRRW